MLRWTSFEELSDETSFRLRPVFGDERLSIVNSCCPSTGAMGKTKPCSELAALRRSQMRMDLTR